MTRSSVATCLQALTFIIARYQQALVLLIAWNACIARGWGWAIGVVERLVCPWRFWGGSTLALPLAPAGMFPSR
jgi:hypothetical protein